MGKHNKKDKKNRKQQDDEDNAEVDMDRVKISKSIVYKKGECSKTIKLLIKDFRKVMEPNTAARLKESKNNTTKDFVNVAGLLGVTHLVGFSTTDIGSYMTIGRIPSGPTITFKVNQFTLMSDIAKIKRRPSSFEQSFLHAPLVVLNNFGRGTPHLEMASTIVQSLFPSINIFTLKLSGCKRVVLFNYDKESKQIEFRHYAIKVADVGVNRSIKRVIQSRVPDVSNLNDISDYILDGIGAAESDYEDGGDGEVNVTSAQINSARMNKSYKVKEESKSSSVDGGDGGEGSSSSGSSSQKKSIKLEEIGPRISLSILKIEEDLFSGSILHHEFITKSEAEKQTIEMNRKEKQIEKERRKAEQQNNVEKKQKDKKRKYLDEGNEDKHSDDDDEEWYRKQVGENPDETFKSSNTSNRSFVPKGYRSNNNNKKNNNYKKNNNNNNNQNKKKFKSK
eukprot:gene4973-6194_t